MINVDNTKKSRRAASLFKIIAIMLLIAATCFAFQYESIKTAIRMRLFTISSDHVVRREEIKEITNQAVSQIETTKEESIAVIDNKAKEIIALNESSPSRDVVPEDVLKAVNRARKETR